MTAADGNDVLLRGTLVPPSARSSMNMPACGAKSIMWPLSEPEIVLVR